jgi:hypothetical protein
VVISARLMSVDRLRGLENLCSDHEVSLSRLHVGLEPLIIGQEPFDESTILPLKKTAS